MCEHTGACPCTHSHTYVHTTQAESVCTEIMAGFAWLLVRSDINTLLRSRAAAERSNDVKLLCFAE